MTKLTLARIAELANADADRARYIHEIQHTLDVDELRVHFDDLARIVERQGRLIADLALAERVLVLPVKENPDAKATVTVAPDFHLTEDDLDRISCVKAGQPGHFGCGWCKEHNRPSFECLCNGARAAVGERMQGPICENVSCGLPVTHGEHFHMKKRWWCDQHVPMSGHYEWCPTPCRDLVRAVTKDPLWDVIAMGHKHLRG